VQRSASLGELTGGRSFSPPAVNLDMTRAILAWMVGAVRCEFVVGFVRETPAGQPRKHRLQVRLRSKKTGEITGGTRSVVY
jgi:hypothetical protein